MGAATAVRARWPVTQLVAAAAAGIGLIGWAASLRGPAGPEVIAVVWLCCLLLCCASGIILHQHWRAMRDPARAWLAVAAVAGGLYSTSQGLPLMSVPGSSGGPAARVVDLLFALVMLVLVRNAARRRPFGSRLGPLGLGFALGLSGLLIRTGSDVALAARHARGPALTALTLAAFLLGVAWLPFLGRITGVTRHARGWVTAGVTLGIVGVALGTPTLSAGLPSPGGRVIPAELVVLAGAAFAVAASRLPWRQLVRTFEPLVDEELPMVAPHEPVVNERDDQLHEVRATLAGLSSAVHLLTDSGSALSSSGRAQLNLMLESEIQRLLRVVECPGVEPSGPLPVVDAVEPLVQVRRATGQAVRCEVSDAIGTLARPDAVREILNVLLVNAATHAPGATATVSCKVAGGTMRLRVADDGPGIPENIRHSLFRRGTRRSGSPGHGIGLDMAHRLARDLGGNLRLTEASTGTAFELQLPASSAEVPA